MEYVVVERRMPEPIVPETVLKLAHDGRGCLDLHRVRYVCAYLGPDRRRLICLFRAPDAESVRIANRQLQVPFETAYPSSLHEAAASVEAEGDGAKRDRGAEGDGAKRDRGAAATVVVERTFAEPALFADVQAQEDRGAWCLDLHGVRFVRSHFSTDRRRMICIYQAPDSEAVRIANQKTGLPFDAVWTATVVEP